jgi:1,2-diacylglycerol 3-alpha-glucosyltransferase
MSGNRMHIAFFTNFYHPVVNGVVRSVASFRQGLMDQGHNVFVFAQADGSYQDTEPFIFRYPSLSLPLASEVIAAIPVSSFVDQLLPSLKLDVIHAHHPILLGQTAARKAAELDLPLVFTFHTKYWEYTHYVPLQQDAIQEFLKNAVHSWLKDFLQRCQHVIIPSESLRNTLVRQYGLESGYSVIPTGTDLKPYMQADGGALRREQGWQADKVVISIGRLAPEKNWETLLRAAAHAYAQCPELRLVMIGEGPERENLERLAQELGVGERVTFTGVLPFDQVPVYLKAADVFAFASITETQGLVTIEAMAAGLPVVAVNGSGTRDIVEAGKQGVLAANDPDSLAAALTGLLADPQKMRELGRNALQRAKEFDIGKLSKQVVGVYEQAIEDKKAQRYVSLMKD